MVKRLLCGALATALVVGTVVAAPTSAAAKVKVPKAAYTFNMDKANKKVVAVARPGDTAEYKCKTPETGVLPKKNSKIKLKYKKGKHKKALYLDRTKSYGAEMTGVKLGKGSWTVSFWTKSDNDLNNFMPVFFTGSNIVNTKKTAWISITQSDWLDGSSNPVIWSHNAALDKAADDQHFPWFSYQNKEGEWVGAKADSKALAIKKNKWVYITLVVNTKDTCEYGEAGTKGYVKSYHAWCYVNGALFGNGTVAKNSMSNSNKFYLGINAWDVPYKGMFDDVQFWKKALTAKQVKQLYKNMK